MSGEGGEALQIDRPSLKKEGNKIFRLKFSEIEEMDEAGLEATRQETGTLLGNAWHCPSMMGGDERK